jgi:hypothetical protein
MLGPRGHHHGQVSAGARGRSGDVSQYCWPGVAMADRARRSKTAKMLSLCSKVGLKKWVIAIGRVHKLAFSQLLPSCRPLSLFPPASSHTHRPLPTAHLSFTLACERRKLLIRLHHSTYPHRHGRRPCACLGQLSLQARAQPRTERLVFSSNAASVSATSTTTPSHLPLTTCLCNSFLTRFTHVQTPFRHTTPWPRFVESSLLSVTAPVERLVCSCTYSLVHMA